MKLPAQAAIIEVLPRDGLQNEVRPKNGAGHFAFFKIGAGAIGKWRTASARLLQEEEKMKLPAKAAIIEVLLRGSLHRRTPAGPPAPSFLISALPRRPGSGPFIDRGPRIAMPLPFGKREAMFFRVHGRCPALQKLTIF